MDNLDPIKGAIHSGTEIVAKKNAEYKFLGSGNKPHRGMFLYALDKEKRVAKSRVHMNPDHPAVWKINPENALKYFEKRFNRKFCLLK